MADPKKFEIQIVTTADNGGAQDTARTLEEVGHAAGKSGDALKEAGHAAEHAGVSHKQFHEIIKGLKADFPELAHLAHMAMNPVTLAVFAGASSWELYKKRVEDAAEALSGIQIANNPALEPGHINAAAEAWKNFHEAVEKTRESYEAVDAAAARTNQKLTEQHTAQVKILEAQKALDLSALDANKSGMSDAKYNSARLEIEQRYGKSGLAEDLSFQRAQQTAKEDTVKEHARVGAFDLAQASKIPVIASKEDDDKNYGKMKADAEKAREDNEKKREEMAKYQRVLDGDGTVGEKFSTMSFLGDAHLKQQMDLLQQGIAANNVIIGNADAFGNRLPGREEQRNRRAELVRKGASETGAFENGAEGFAEGRASFNESIHTTKQTAAMAAMTRALNAYANMAEETKKAGEEISSKGASGIPAALLRAYEEDRKALVSLQKQINAIRKTNPIANQ